MLMKERGANGGSQGRGKGPMEGDKGRERGPWRVTREGEGAHGG